MATIPEAFSFALQQQQAGRLEAARQIYRQILAVEPSHAYAHNNLGAALKDQGNLDEAAVCFRRALELQPDYCEAHFNLGNLLRDQGQLDEAVASFRRALELKPDFAVAHINLGVTLKDQGKLDEAAASCRRAADLMPGYAEAYGNLGVVLKEMGRAREAMACWRRAVELSPGYAAAYNNLGVALRDEGAVEEATACYRRALEANPRYAQAHNNLGVVLMEAGRLEEATACCRRAVELKPDYAEAHNNLGNSLKEQGKLDEAAACCGRAVALRPDFAVFHNNLGNVAKEQGKLEAAAACYRRAIELDPAYAEAHNNLGNVRKDQGLTDEAIACYRRALDLKPDYVAAHSNLLFAMQYRTGITPAALAEAHADYDRRHARFPDLHPSSFIPHPSSHLRLGFVSPDFGRHPVGYFLVRVLENFDRADIASICYCDRRLKDDLTHRLQAAATEWRDTVGWSDRQFAEQITADRIDILFDLAGHTARNRLPVFARRPAPLQVTWAGYVGTTGLAAMDYLLADRYEVPPEAERHYRERVLRMPDGYVCYDPPAYAPPVGPLPALRRGGPVLGCFNNPAKITPQAVEVWARILGRLPGARLVMKFPAWDDAGVAERFGGLFAAAGIDPARLDFLGHSPHAEFLAAYGGVDLALDTFPYSGGLTTCEALWMGVPVVTCPGETFAGRHSLSHLSNVGLTETIARDLDVYVERAVSLAGDLPHLAALRAGLRERMARSPLCDGPRFARNLAALLREAWTHRHG